MCDDLLTHKRDLLTHNTALYIDTQKRPRHRNGSVRVERS